MLPICAVLAGCSLTPSEDRQFDPQVAFDQLDGPDVPTVEQSLARAAMEAEQKGDHARAAGLYEQLIDHDTTNMRYKFGLAESLRRLGENRVSIELYDEVIAAQPALIEAYEGKALAVMASGDTERAARLFEQLLKRDGTRWRTLNALGVMFAARKMPDEALAYFKEAEKHSPRNPAILNNLALSLAMKQQYDAAFSAFARGARESEGTQQMQIELNHALVRGISGDMQTAEKLASKHLTGAGLQNNLGLYAHLANNTEMAKSFLNMALTGTPVHYKRAWENLDIIARENKKAAQNQLTPPRRIEIPQ